MFLNGSLDPQYIGRCFLLSRGSLLSVHDTPENITGLPANKCSTLVRYYNVAVSIFFTLEKGKLFTYFKLTSVNFLSFKCIFLPCPVSFVFVNRVEMGGNLISDGIS